jgi:hypothetical protein
MMAAAMLSRKGRRCGIHNNNDGKEKVVEVDDNDETVAASGGDGRRKVGFEQ